MEQIQMMKTRMGTESTMEMRLPMEQIQMMMDSMKTPGIFGTGETIQIPTVRIATPWNFQGLMRLHFSLSVR